MQKQPRPEQGESQSGLKKGAFQSKRSVNQSERKGDQRNSKENVKEVAKEAAKEAAKKINTNTEA